MNNKPARRQGGKKQKLEKDLSELFNQNVSKDKIYERLGISPTMMRKRLEKNIVKYINFNK